MTKIIAPSILSADFSKLGEEIKAVEAAGAGWIHLDVMDGHFVPNLTMGPALAKSARSVTKLPFDAHLMVERPVEFVEAFAKAGVDYISIHCESERPNETIAAIREYNAKPGIVVNPPTDVKETYQYLDKVDYVLVMTVNPGFSGQKMIEEAAAKVDVLKDYREKNNLNYLIEVDGGVNLETISRVKNADVFVAASAIFGTDDYAKAINALKALL